MRTATLAREPAVACVTVALHFVPVIAPSVLTSLHVTFTPLMPMPAGPCSPRGPCGAGRTACSGRAAPAAAGRVAPGAPGRPGGPAGRTPPVDRPDRCSRPGSLKPDDVGRRVVVRRVRRPTSRGSACRRRGRSPARPRPSSRCRCASCRRGAQRPVAAAPPAVPGWSRSAHATTLDPYTFSLSSGDVFMNFGAPWRSTCRGRSRPATARTPARSAASPPAGQTSAPKMKKPGRSHVPGTHSPPVTVTAAVVLERERRAALSATAWHRRGRRRGASS